MDEVISGIQAIKIYSWEKPFERIVKKVRSAEIADIKITSYYRGLFMSCCLFLDKTALFLSIICFVCMGYQVTSDRVFSMAQYFNLIQLMLAIYCPQAIGYSAECLISLRRLKDFLMMEEKEDSAIRNLSGGSVQIDKVFANWTPTTPTLEDISVKIPVGTLCIVVGPVGSGKSSLLQVIQSIQTIFQ